MKDRKLENFRKPEYLMLGTELLSKHCRHVNRAEESITTLNTQSAPLTAPIQVYEGLGGSRRGGEAWSTSVRHPGGGDGTGEDGLEKEGREGRGAGGGGGGAGGFAEDEVRAAERLGIPVREVRFVIQRRDGFELLHT